MGRRLVDGRCDYLLRTAGDLDVTTFSRWPNHFRQTRRFTKSTNKPTKCCSFSGSVMIVTDDSGNLPSAVFVLPQVNELSFANALFGFISGVMKAMNAHFDCAVSFHVINL